MLVRASYASGCAGGEADLIGGFNVRRCVRDGADGLGCGEWCTASLSEVVGWAGAWRAYCRRRVTYLTCAVCMYSSAVLLHGSDSAAASTHVHTVLHIYCKCMRDFAHCVGLRGQRGFPTQSADARASG